MRRRAGVGAIQRRKETQLKYTVKRAELEESQLEELSRQMDAFKTHLQRFAANHSSEIKRDPRFRKQFQDMCAAIGVDPLASSKGFWAELLGVGDFYYELSVRVVETCLAAAPRTGGLMPLSELQRRLTAVSSTREQTQPSLDDLTRAIGKLRVLGTGFQLVRLSGDQLLVQSVPGELSGDQTALLEAARAAGGRYQPGQLGWSDERELHTLQLLIRDEMAWVDEQAAGGRQYWFPSLVPALYDAD